MFYYVVTHTLPSTSLQSRYLLRIFPTASQTTHLCPSTSGFFFLPHKSLNCTVLNRPRFQHKGLHFLFVLYRSLLIYLKSTTYRNMRCGSSLTADTVGVTSLYQSPCVVLSQEPTSYYPLSLTLGPLSFWSLFRLYQ